MRSKKDFTGGLSSLLGETIQQISEETPVKSKPDKEIK